MKVILEGKCEYAQVLPGQEREPHPDAVKKGADPSDRSYAITVECARDQFKQIKRAGLNAMHNLKEKDEDDSTWLTIKATKKKTTAKGSWTFEDPIVIDKDGNSWPANVNIGNGSVVRIEAALRQAGNAKALQLKSVQVLEHVEYTKDEDDGEVLDFTSSSKTETKKPTDEDIF